MMIFFQTFPYLSRRKFYHSAEIAEVPNHIIGDEGPSSLFEAREHVSKELNDAEPRIMHLREIEGHSLRATAHGLHVAGTCRTRNGGKWS